MPLFSSRPGLSGAQSLVDAWATLRSQEVASFSPIDLLAGFFGVRDHLLAASRLRALIRKWVEIGLLEDAKTAVVIVATDAPTGEAVVLQRGDVLEAITASAAIPGLLPSVRMGDRWLIDGSLSAGCPVLQAQDLGADDVYMITPATAPRVRPPRGAVAMAMNSVSLVTARSNQAQLEVARLRQSRTFHIDPETVAVLKRHCDVIKQQAADAGTELTADAYLSSLAPDCSTPMPPDHLTKRVGVLKGYLGTTS
jgi:NTE family protein